MKKIMNKFTQKLDLLTLAGLLMVGMISLSAFASDPNQEIMGTWISEKDPKVKWTFLENGKCIWYYDNQQRKYFDFMISNTSPQCSKTVDIDAYTNYLKLTSNNDYDDFCYLANGINFDNSGILSLTSLKTNKILIFNKQ